ncbi:MAG TPA: hypothetical protein VFJ81_00055 [Gemmatimonadales bacterium]|nr:hypothetical protein [Gemmatimonadales bacterium]
MGTTAVPSSAVPLLLLSLQACGSIQNATTPVEPLARETPAMGEVPDAILLDVIRQSELIVLAVPQDLIPADGFTPTFQLGAKETWYNVRLTVDTVVKGHLGQAKTPDYGFLPKMFEPAAPFDHLSRNEIVVQYPAVNTIKSDWVAAPPPVVGERAVWLFRRCYNCVPIGLATGRGPYKANPLVAQGWGSKLAAEEWPRVLGLLDRAKRRR